MRVEVTDDVRCDRCDESMKSASGNINGVTVSGSGGYDSTEFPDCSIVHADVCEKCCGEWFATFKRNPITPADF